jgi:2-polyprenyl-6-methoxyphenol hydroxylase-like FAD-dependent oxidoreductase
LDACIHWVDGGDFTRSDDTYLDSEPLKALSIAADGAASAVRNHLAHAVIALRTITYSFGSNGEGYRAVS